MNAGKRQDRGKKGEFFGGESYIVEIFLHGRCWSVQQHENAP